ncbi:methylase involved in ubiquinone/menaquinone biosynthesis (plasmid) [Mycolicibacterium gilvum Spyr1]|uniref:Methylase involved in ubiquinone/menaquinone biosynthesis n=3 Tax=Mycolicibacterium TaxID=1866885 RepID=E6TQ75_MYCSR|nr:methylase involved in ubiquinone/menaquinone biosynthesis [Mycolicibacterium gilvum Spyr1]
MDLSTFQHPRFARMYERISAESEERGTAERLDHALAGLSGRVIEVGAGNGLNFGHYPPTVAEVVAVEPDDHLRGLAAQAAESAPVPVQVLAGHATALPVEDGGFDAVVASLVLCSVPDQRAALAEMRRVPQARRAAAVLRTRTLADPLAGSARGCDHPAVVADRRRLPSQPRHHRSDPGRRLRHRNTGPVLLRAAAALSPIRPHPRPSPSETRTRPRRLTPVSVHRRPRPKTRGTTR